ncbi:MAG TPA: hypothetical protein VHO01_02990 [Jatrophihabitans sp.]|nr:hypothetical protein [Jatrophihabitans sp.]
MSDLQAVVASAADSAAAHSTAPALLLQAVAAVGRLAGVTDRATEAGRRPFRIPHDWPDELAELAWLVYLLADQTGVDLDAAVRAIAGRVTSEAAAERARQAANRTDDSWF